MAAKPFLTDSTGVILQAVANGYLYGFAIINVTGLPGGTVYPALRRRTTRGISRPHGRSRASRRPNRVRPVATTT